MEWLRKIESRVRKAKKRRTCSCCDHVIQPGEFYEHQVFVSNHAPKPFVHVFVCKDCYIH